MERKNRKAVIREEIVVIPTYQQGEPEKNPLFIEKRAYQGSTGKVYPLPVTEKITNNKIDKEYNAIILENDYLYVMVLPELGGRIQRALDKTNGYDFVYYNQVIKPALVGLAGPWISGGIEFNWPQHHRPSTFAPVDYKISENPDGSVTAFISETDVMYGTKSLLKISLYPDKAYIELDGQFYNPTDLPQTFLWWANPAVSVNDNTFSVFPPDVNAVVDHGKRAVSTFPIATGEYYKVDYSAGVDISRYKNIPVPTSYMAAHSDFDFIGNFDEGRDAGLLHVADHHFSPGKKQWTWGNCDFGKMWDKNLTDEDGPYIELMTGVYTDNQPDFTWLKPNEEKRFTQYFMPYKTVGRVSNATKECCIGLSGTTLKVYATSEYDDAVIIITDKDKVVFECKADLSPEKCFVTEVPELQDFCITVCDKTGAELVEYKKFVPGDIPVPDPMAKILKPEEIESLEELYLAGQHLEQYRHATYNPADYYIEGLRRDPSDIRINNAYGLWLLRKGCIKESVPYFEAAIKKQTWRNPNPYSGECYYNLGLAYELLQEDEKAYDAFYKATWSAETAGNAFYHLACISTKSGDFKKALEHIDKALIKNWHNMNARALKGELLKLLEKDNSQFLDESLDIDPLSFGVLFQKASSEELVKAMGNRLSNYINLADLYLHMGIYDGVQTIMKLCPVSSPLVKYYCGYAESLRGNKEKAKEYYSAAEKCNADYCFPNTVSEQLILEDAIALLDKAPLANYLLGNLLYDKKLHNLAIKKWEKAAEEGAAIPMVQRNLSIAYYNVQEDEKKALSAIRKAVEQAEAAGENISRFLLELDQLSAKAGVSKEERLAVLSAHKKECEDRDTLMLAYARVLNMNGRYEEALEALDTHTFHVWEGGEGKVADEYKTALFGLADEAMAKGDYEKAICYVTRTLVYPDNLGEGKLPNVPDNRAYYTIGLCHKAMENADKADEYFRLATEGKIMPEPVRYYNDQPSDYIYWIGKALQELGEEDKAEKAFESLVAFGEEHLKDVVEYDFFAVSMPELEVYKENIQKRSDDYCRRMIELGKKR
ncbi:MAG: DUF5107 domain-containing protein [Lachnospiraceae bacterium]|nr:DUF5107 domain-containing protein [Lachnospiraceae bacterium]